MAADSILDTKNLSKAFGAHRVVRGVSVSIGGGEIVGLVGPNGSGKSTLINLISGFLQADGGSVLLAGEDVTRLAPNVISCKGLIRTFQLPSMPLRMTIWELMLVASRVESGYRTIFPGGRRGGEDVAEQLLNELGLASMRNQSAGALSGGQKKLLCIAMALRTRPKVLCLDEPTAGVHASLRSSMIELLRKINANGVTLLIVEHDMHFVRQLCSRSLVLDRGEIIADCAPSDLAHNERVVEAYLGQAASRRMLAEQR